MAGGTQVGSLYSSLTLESASFISGMKEAANQTAASTKSIERNIESMKKFVEVAFGAETINLVTETVSKALEYAGSLGSISQQLGVTTRDLQVYRYAASQVGVSQQDMESGLQRFTKALSAARAGVVNTREVFKQLGFTDSDIRRLDVHEALLKTADGLAQLRDGATRAAPEVRLLGEAGQRLDPLLARGSAGINALADAAEHLGLVLTPEQIENADRAAGKFAELKKVLEANIAGAVADNAGAIFNLASALERVAVAAVKAFDALNNGGNLDILKHPLLTKLGSSVTGADPTQVREQAIADLIGSKSGRQALFDKVQAGIRTLNSGSAYIPDLGIDAPDNAGSISQTKAQLLALRQRIVAAERASQSADKPDQSSGGRGYTDPAAAEAARRRAEAAAKAAEAARVKEAQRERQVAQQNARLDDQYLSAREGVSANVTARASIERDRLDADTKAQLTELADQVTAGKVTAAEAAILRAKIERNAAAEADVINQRENIALEQETLAVAQAHLDNARDYLQEQEGLARTAADRRKIELELLANARKREELELAPILADADRPVSERHYSDADIAKAQDRYSNLGAIYGAKTAAVTKSTAGPGEQYLDSLISSAGEANEALQSIEVEGLKSLNDGLAEAALGTKKLGDVFGDVANQIVGDLLKIAIQKEVIGPLANALFGGATVDTSQFLTGSNFTAAPLHFATGGSFKVGGAGGPDSKLFNMALSPGEAVEVTHGDAGGRRGGVTVNQTIQVTGGVDLVRRADLVPLVTATKQATMAAITDQDGRR